MVRIKFPESVSPDIRDRAQFLVMKDVRMRLLRLSLPSTLKKIAPEGLPVLLESISVAAGNKEFMSANGVLFDKAGRMLIRFPGYTGASAYNVPDGTEVIESGAFACSFISKVVIPSTVRRIEAFAFA